MEYRVAQKLDCIQILAQRTTNEHPPMYRVSSHSVSKNVDVLTYGQT